jgi:hypothetical protein
MADFGRGIKAGVATAGVYLAISAILGAIYQNNPLSVPYFIYGTGLTLLTWMALTNPLSVFFVLFQYAVRGIIFGAVFAALYSFLPGTKSVGKVVVLSLFLCIVALVESVYTTLGWPTAGISLTGTYYIGMISLSSISLALAGIISALVYGALTGFLWDRFRATRLAGGRRASPILLVSFIFGVLMWAILAIGFIIGVGIGGLPMIEPGPGWWYGILATLVVFLGLPGWMLALVAWRQTRRGESGFKWGVAGGVMMALTGIMLLPGALAITGGVLSRRQPGSEPVAAATEQ